MGINFKFPFVCYCISIFKCPILSNCSFVSDGRVSNYLAQRFSNQRCTSHVHDVHYEIFIVDVRLNDFVE